MMEELKDQEAPRATDENQKEQVAVEDPLAKDLWAFASKRMTQSKYTEHVVINNLCQSINS